MEYWKTLFSPSRNLQFFSGKEINGHEAMEDVLRSYNTIASYCMDTKGSEHLENCVSQGRWLKGRQRDWSVVSAFSVTLPPLGPGCLPSLSLWVLHLRADWLPSPKRLVMGNKWAPTCQREGWDDGVRGKRQFTELSLRPRERTMWLSGNLARCIWLRGLGLGEVLQEGGNIHVCLVLLQGRKIVWKYTNPIEQCDEVSFG